MQGPYHLTQISTTIHLQIDLKMDMLKWNVQVLVHMRKYAVKKFGFGASAVSECLMKIGILKVENLTAEMNIALQCG